MLEFCGKRIATSIGSAFKQGDGDRMWNLVFPKYQPDPDATAIREDSFSYILRHTMMRPRDFQIHWAAIRGIASDGKITTDDVRYGLQDGCADLTKAYHEEWSKEYPFVPGLMALLRGSPCVFEYDDKFEKKLAEGAKIVNGYLSAIGDTANITLPFNCYQKRGPSGEVQVTSEFVVTLLYTLGFLGKMETENSKIKSTERKYNGEAYWCWFSCYQQTPNLRRGDRVIIHPIFHLKYDVKPAPPFLVGPG